MAATKKLEDFLVGFLEEALENYEGLKSAGEKVRKSGAQVLAETLAIALKEKFKIEPKMPKRN